MTTIDETRNHFRGQVDFKDREEEYKHLYNKLINYLKTEEIPPLPTREEELQYLKDLETQISTDKWITIHPKRYMANPNRNIYKTRFAYRREYLKKFILNGLGSALILSPFIFHFANKRRYASSGVPFNAYLPKDLFLPLYKLPPIEKNFYTRRTFKYGLLKYSTIVFLVGGLISTDYDYLKCGLMTRPDFNHQRIMANIKDLPDKERKVFEIFEGNYFGLPFKDQPSSWIKRFKERFYYSVHYNPPSSHYVPFYDFKKNRYHPDDISSYYSN